MSFMVPLTLMLNTRFQTSSETSWTGVMLSMMPAMLASPSMRSPAASTMAATAASSVISPATVTMLPSGSCGGKFVQALGGDVDGDDAAALAGNPRGRGPANAGTGSRDDDGLARETARGDLLNPGRRLRPGLGWRGATGACAAVRRECHRRSTRCTRRIHHVLGKRTLADLNQAVQRQFGHGTQIGSAVWPPWARRARSTGPPAGSASQV